MKEKRKKLIETFCSWHFMKFLMIGAINTLSGTIIAFFYSMFFDVNVSFVLGYVTSLAIAYGLNSVWNFKTKMKWSRFGKFVVSYIPNFIIQNVVVIIVYNIMDLHKLIAYLMAAVLGIPVTYVLVKFFALKKEGSESVDSSDRGEQGDK